MTTNHFNIVIYTIQKYQSKSQMNTGMLRHIYTAISISLVTMALKILLRKND